MRRRPIPSLAAAVAATSAGLVLVGAGCALIPPNSFLDPTKVGRFGIEFSEGGIRRVLTPRETPLGLANATEPTPEDLVANVEEYRVGPGDQLALSVDDLSNTGQPFQSAQEVSGTGFIRVPDLGPIKVIGMTDHEIEREITSRLRESKLLVEPIVVVAVQAKRNQFYSIMGDVVLAAQYPILQPNFRLLEAIAQARDIGPQVKSVYIIRRNEPRYGFQPTPAAPQAPTKPATTPSRDGLVIPVPTEEDNGMQGTLFSSLEKANAGREAAAPRLKAQTEPPPSRSEMQDVLAPTKPGSRPAAHEPPAGQPAYPPLIFDPSKAAPIEAPAEKPKPAPPSAPSVADEKPFDWEDVPDYETSQRVIEIDVPALKAGDPRYNVVVRDRDVIISPVDTSVFYVMGEINRPGVYSLSGREITIKQAVGSIAGGFTPLAWPQRTEIIRRERGTDKQLTIPVNLDAVYAGLEADILLRDDDIINVGSHTLAPFLFVIRNSFRFTYGFGFVYDRNYADIDSYGNKINPQITQQERQARRGLPF